MGKLNSRLWGAVRKNDMEASRLEQRRAQAAIRLLEKYGQEERDEGTERDYMYEKRGKGRGVAVEHS